MFDQTSQPRTVTLKQHPSNFLMAVAVLPVLCRDVPTMTGLH
jgi:hypothetical protein